MGKGPTKEFLIYKYINEHKAINKIADECKFSVGTIYNYLLKYNIKRRKIGDYETSPLVIKNARELGLKGKGKKLSDETKKKLSKSKEGKFRRVTKFGGHKKTRGDGYISVYKPGHNELTKTNYVMEHILVMENYIGRKLKKDEIVHHINKTRNDNRIENLLLMTFKEHAKFHMLERHMMKKERKMTYQ